MYHHRHILVRQVTSAFLILLLVIVLIVEDTSCIKETEEEEDNSEPNIDLLEMLSNRGQQKTFFDTLLPLLEMCFSILQQNINQVPPELQKMLSKSAIKAKFTDPKKLSKALFKFLLAINFFPGDWSSSEASFTEGERGSPLATVDDPLWQRRVKLGDISQSKRKVLFDRLPELEKDAAKYRHIVYIFTDQFVIYLDKSKVAVKKELVLITLEILIKNLIPDWNVIPTPPSCIAEHGQMLLIIGASAVVLSGIAGAVWKYVFKAATRTPTLPPRIPVKPRPAVAPTLATTAASVLSGKIIAIGVVLCGIAIGGFLWWRYQMAAKKADNQAAEADGGDDEAKNKKNKKKKQKRSSAIESAISGYPISSVASSAVSSVVTEPPPPPTKKKKKPTKGKATKAKVASKKKRKETKNKKNKNKKMKKLKTSSIDSAEFKSAQEEHHPLPNRKKQIKVKVTISTPSSIGPSAVLSRMHSTATGVQSMTTVEASQANEEEESTS